MKNLRSFLIVFAILIFAGSLSAQNIYLHYPGVTNGKGPAGIHNHEVLLSSVAGGVHQEGSFGLSTIPVFTPYSLTKNFDGSSLLIMKELAKGNQTDGVEIRFFAGDKGGKEVMTLKIELKGALITAYSAAAASCDGCPTMSETISIDFEAIKIGTFSWNKRENDENF